MLEKGIYVSMITPFIGGREIHPKIPWPEVDWLGLEKNIEFQISSGVDGILFVEAINGESATLSPEEHCLVLEKGIKTVSKRVFCLAGTGSNSLSEALEYTGKAKDLGYKAAVLIAPYCNPVSSYDIREYYYRKIAGSFLRMIIIPHTIPGRTAVIEPVDLAFLEWKTPNISSSIEVKNNGNRIEAIKDLTMPDFGIFSGDDVETWQMISQERFRGVFSAISNIAPQAVRSMIRCYFQGEIEEAERIKNALSPILLTSIEEERSVLSYKKTSIISERIFNPVVIKAMMTELGMPAGPCRYPLGSMSEKSLLKIRKALKAVWCNNPWVLKPVEDFYGVNLDERLG